MSYAQNQHSRRGRARRSFRLEEARRSAMGVDFIDESVQQAVDGGSVFCRIARDTATASFDFETNELARTWKPTNDLYTVADMAKLRDKVMSLLVTTSQAVDAAMVPSLTYKDTLRMAKSMLTSKQADAAQFTSAINEAAQAGIKYIHSPGFKRWVINSLNKVSVARGHIQYMACIKPEILTWVERAKSMWDQAVSFAKSLLRLADALLDIALKVPDWLTMLVKAAPFLGVAGLGFIAYRKFAPKHT